MFNPYKSNDFSLFKNLLSNKNPQEIYNYMIESNPKFKQFVDKNKDKTIEDIALEYDIDLNLLKKFL